jgi:glycosyltransferase involved in cell wall biosynthesis
MKARLLLIVPLPPPMHGSNLMNQHVIQCRELYQQFDVKVLPLNYAKSISDIGSFRIQKFFLLLVYLTRLVTELKKFQPDIAYFVPAITGGSFYRDCLFAALLKCFKVKTVYHLHGKGIADKLSSPVLFHLYRWFFKDAFIIHLSPMLYGDIQSIVDFNQCRFLPNGIDMPIALKNDKKSIGRDNPPKFLFLSNLVPTKGPLILLEACKILLEKGVSFKTYFVGNPSSELTKSYLSQNIKQMGLCNYVEYLGPLYGGEKHDVLLNSDCLVFPT